MKHKNKEKELAKSTATAVPFLTEGIGTRISDACKQLGDRKYAAKLLGVSADSLYRYIREDISPSIETMTKLSVEAGVSIEWLVSGKESISSKVTADSKEDSTFAYIPRYDVTAAAGCGVVIESEKVIDSLAFSKQWITNKLRMNAEDLYLINVDGESMEPTLRQGNVILVNHTDTAVTRDGIYVLRIGDSLLVKRLQRLPNSIVKVTSDNPAYQPFDIDLSDNSSNEVSIIGRAVWSGHEL